MRTSTASIADDARCILQLVTRCVARIGGNGFGNVVRTRRRFFPDYGASQMEAEPIMRSLNVHAFFRIAFATTVLGNAFAIVRASF